MCPLSFSWAYCYSQNKEDQAGNKNQGLDIGQVTNCFRADKDTHGWYSGNVTVATLTLGLEL